ncbi:MAG: CCA tRNA nucleotidyltransferase [Bryobacteraceae bacterium]
MARTSEHDIPAIGVEARNIALRLRDAGHGAFLVGGCVRDMLLGRVPGDFDVATSATPDRILALFPRAQPVGAHFGVMLVGEVEVATFRSDHDYRDGRHPDHVHFETDPRQDALRRDFTINALFLDPASGRVLDFVDGRRDLDLGVIRAVGDAASRFAEDHLRMLRAIRFAARLGFSIDEQAAAAIGRLAPRIHAISAERIRDEIARILTEGHARRGFELLDETGLLAEILPEVAAMKGVEQPPEFHPEGDVWIHTRMMLQAMAGEGTPPPSLTLALGILLHDVAKPPTFRVADRIRFDGHAELGARMARAILERLRFSNATVDRVEALVAHHMRFKDAPRMRESTLKRFLRMDGFDEHLELHRIDCGASHGNLDNYEFVRAKLAALPVEQLKPPRLLTGDDLIAMGLAPGPAFKQILEDVETAQLEDRIATREDAIRFVEQRFSAPIARTSPQIPQGAEP